MATAATPRTSVAEPDNGMTPKSRRAISDHLVMVALDADEADDFVRADFLADRLAFHDDAAWMLRSIASCPP